jgi:hypothetical protein
MLKIEEKHTQKVELKSLRSSLCKYLICCGKEACMYSCVHATRTKEPRKCYQQLIYVPKLKGRHNMRIATAVIACLVDSMSLETIGTEKVSDE